MLSLSRVPHFYCYAECLNAECRGARLGLEQTSYELITIILWVIMPLRVMEITLKRSSLQKKVCKFTKKYFEID